MSGNADEGRIFNFSAGPAVLPLPVLEQARDEMLCLPGAGASVMEISHRSSEFVAILADAKERICQLLGVGDTHEVLFLQGGSRLQFSMVPANLYRSTQDISDYIVSGSWGAKALAEAKKEGTVNVAWDGKPSNYDRLPGSGDVSLSADPAYVYYTSNETIQGVQFPTEPESGGAPLVCDASSDFLSRPLEMSKYGILYACAQKNAGPAGVTVVVIEKDLLQRSTGSLPGYLNYQEHASADSMYNTPPTFGIYLLGLVCKWIENEFGNLKELSLANEAKAARLYEAIDTSGGFYQGHALPDCRSKMNVCFRLADDDLMQDFLRDAAAEGMGSLKGHRSVGGIRASIYNAMPKEGVEKLRQFMIDFAQKHG